MRIKRLLLGTDHHYKVSLPFTEEPNQIKITTFCINMTDRIISRLFITLIVFKLKKTITKKHE